ncbi:MAG TPA: hypothetical protein VI653_06900 [Steroidobacteraceae bacterium]
MSEPMTSSMTSEDSLGADCCADSAGDSSKPTWETPKMEDVSEQVMAQPYIRFT